MEVLADFALLVDMISQNDVNVPHECASTRSSKYQSTVDPPGRMIEIIKFTAQLIC